MSHLADKMKRLADGAKGLTATVEAQVDAALADQADVARRAQMAVDSLTAVTADAKAGTAALEEALKGITN